MFGFSNYWKINKKLLFNVRISKKVTTKKGPISTGRQNNSLAILKIGSDFPIE